MSVTEIIQEIEKLSGEERQKVRDYFWQLEYDDDLTPEQWAIIEQRCLEDEAHPEQRIHWEVARAQIEDALLKKKQCA